jgi:hypothetical protein
MKLMFRGRGPDETKFLQFFCNILPIGGATVVPLAMAGLSYFGAVLGLHFTNWILDYATSGRPFAGSVDAMKRPKKTCAALLVVSLGPMATSASAITAEIAKKCQVLTVRAYPPRVVGNPAAGSAKGSGRDQRAYFKKCIDNGGKVDDGGSKETK